jgi:hypothetical protein
MKMDGEHGLTKTGLSYKGCMGNGMEERFIITSSPVTGKTFVVDPQKRLVHLNSCPRLHKQIPQDRKYNMLRYALYQRCPQCMG